MTVHRYVAVGPNRYRADWLTGDSIEVDLTRERSYPGLGLGEVHACMYAEALEAWRGEEIAVVIDAGCGSGYGTGILRRAGYNVYGVDVDPTAVGFATIEYGPWFDQGCLTAIPHDDDTACAVAAVESIEHVEDDRKAMAEMWRVLRPGGLLWLTTPETRPERNVSPYHVREYERDELVALVEGAGFVNVSVWLGKHDFQETFRLAARKP